MKELHLIPAGTIPQELMLWLQREFCEMFRIPCTLLQPALDPAPFCHPERRQYHATEMLEALATRSSEPAWRVLGVTDVDLYVPVLGFVFGEADPAAAIVSTRRLQQDNYGLPPDPPLLARRLLTEAAHQLGHSADLAHCDDHRCVMASSHTVEKIDIKEPAFCPACKARISRAIPGR